jgi:AraC-like DNA-binding protein
MTAMVRAGGLRGYRELVRTLGGRPDDLLRQFHIAPESLDNEDTLISLRSFAHLLEASAVRLDVPDFGLRLAAMQDIGILGPLAVAMQNAETLVDAMEFAARYLFVHSPGIAMTVSSRSPSQPDFAEIRFEVLLPRLSATRQILDLGLGVIHRVLKMLAGQDYRPEEVHLTHQPTAPMSIYRRYYMAPIRTSQLAAALLLRPDLLKRPMTAVNATLRQMATDYLAVLFPAPSQALSARVRVALRKVLGTHLANKEDVAAMLAMHPRTMQRRLATEGASFDAIRDDVRRELAQRCLVSTEMPVIQIVGLLGLSEQAALTRMCRRWFGTTPSALRRMARERDLAIDELAPDRGALERGG